MSQSDTTLSNSPAQGKYPGKTSYDTARKNARRKLDERLDRLAKVWGLLYQAPAGTRVTAQALTGKSKKFEGVLALNFAEAEGPEWPEGWRFIWVLTNNKSTPVNEWQEGLAVALLEQGYFGRLLLSIKQASQCVPEHLDSPEALERAAYAVGGLLNREVENHPFDPSIAHGAPLQGPAWAASPGSDTQKLFDLDGGDA